MFDHFFDIETTPIGADPFHFVLGFLLDGEGNGRGYYHRDEEGMVDHLLGCEGKIWSHNGGRFDLLWLADHLLSRGVKFQAAVSGTRVVRLSVGKAVFCDSAALFKMRLFELTSECGVSKEMLDLPCRHLSTCIDPREPTKPCGGYCWIYRGSPKSKRIMDYCEQDTRSLAAACAVMEAFALENGIELGITVGATAWKTARSWLELPDAELGFSEHRKLRRGLYGGRCQVFRPRAEKGHIYDVRSMYPWALSSVSLPWGVPTWKSGRDARADYGADRPGYYRATVDVPRMFVPPLPARTRMGRNSYPTGKWDGWFAAPELHYAETLGCAVTPVESATWPEARPIFAPWAEKLFALRDKVGRKTPRGQWVKFLLNALTGKLAAKPEKDQVDGFQEMQDAVPCGNTGPCRNCGPFCFPGCRNRVGDCGGCCRHHCSGRCGCHRLISPGLWARTVYRLEPCSRPEWAGYLYAVSRVRLHKLLTEGGADDACYTDTDSCLSLGERSGVGAALGDLEHSDVRYFRARAPKLYGLEKRDDGKSEWERVYRAKGFAVQDDRALLGEPVGSTRLRGFRSGAREGKFFAGDVQVRTSKVGYGDRILDGDVTRAPTVAEAGVIGEIR